MKKITFISPNLKSGAGIERITAILINHFVKIGCKVQLILLWDNLIEFDLPKNVKITYMGFSNQKRLSYAVVHINELIQKIEGDTIYSLMNPASDISVLAGKLSGKRVIVAERNDPRSFPFSKKMRMIRNISYRFADKIVFQTEEQRRYFSKKIQKKGVIICNPIRNNMPAPYNGIRNKHIVTTGRIDTQKNLPLLFSSYARIAHEYPDYDLFIYGKGRLEEEMRNLAEQLGMAKRIHFEGFKNNVDDIIKDSAMFVLSSDFEGISNAMIEALALGIPTICTDCPIGGARQMIEDEKNGLLVPVKDEDALYKAMKKIIEMPNFADKLAEEGKKIRLLYPEDKIVQEWLGLAK